MIYPPNTNCYYIDNTNNKHYLTLERATHLVTGEQIVVYSCEAGQKWFLTLKEWNKKIVNSEGKTTNRFTFHSGND